MEFEKLLTSLGLKAEDFADMDALLRHINLVLSRQNKATELGIDLDKATKETLLHGEGLAALKGEVEGEKAKAVSLATERDAFKLKAEKFDAQVIGVREKAETKYRAAQLAKNLPVDDAIVSLIKESDPDKVESLMKSFGVQFSEHLAGKCGKCGSDNITFKSADNTEEEKEIEEYSSQDFFREAAEKSRKFLN